MDFKKSTISFPTVDFLLKINNKNIDELNYEDCKKRSEDEDQKLFIFTLNFLFFSLPFAVVLYFLFDWELVTTGLSFIVGFIITQKIIVEVNNQIKDILEYLESKERTDNEEIKNEEQE